MDPRRLRPSDRSDHVARVSASRSAGEVERADGTSITGEVGGHGPVVVVTAVHLSAEARMALAERLGPGHIVRDIREAGNVADIVLVPAMSGQGIGELRQMFPGAKLLAGEFVDEQYGVDIRGPIRRALDNAVDGYFLAPDLSSVAQATRDAAMGRPFGVLEAASSAMTSRLGLQAPQDDVAPRRGTLHLVDARDVRSAAGALNAVALDATEWISRLRLDDTEQHRQVRLLLSALTEDLLARGVDVVCASAPEDPPEGSPGTPSG